jgi:hypothetical protein
MDAGQDARRVERRKGKLRRLGVGLRAPTYHVLPYPFGIAFSIADNLN